MVERSLFLIRDPENTLNESDPGADVFQRFRYQATYAAILALGMLRHQPHIVAVYAEHHDDILLKMESGRFQAVQVKTKQQGSKLFKSSDKGGAR